MIQVGRGEKLYPTRAQHPALISEHHCCPGGPACVRLGGLGRRGGRAAPRDGAEERARAPRALACGRLAVCVPAPAGSLPAAPATGP